MSHLYARDLLERCAATFGVAFLAQLIGSGWFSIDGITDLSILTKAGLAGGAAALSLVKGLAARLVGDADSASLVPSIGVIVRHRADGRDRTLASREL